MRQAGVLYYVLLDFKYQTNLKPKITVLCRSPFTDKYIEKFASDLVWTNETVTFDSCYNVTVFFHPIKLSSS